VLVAGPNEHLPVEPSNSMPAMPLKNPLRTNARIRVHWRSASERGRLHNTESEHRPGTRAAGAGYRENRY
jgi:hypothetical protein